MQHPLAGVGTAWRQESVEKAYPELYWKKKKIRELITGEGKSRLGTIVAKVEFSV